MRQDKEVVCKVYPTRLVFFLYYISTGLCVREGMVAEHRRSACSGRERRRIVVDIGTNKRCRLTPRSIIVYACNATTCVLAAIAFPRDYFRFNPLRLLLLLLYTTPRPR